MVYPYLYIFIDKRATEMVGFMCMHNRTSSENGND